MSIHLILGPMFSGKTTELLRLARRNELARMKVVYVKHHLDAKRHATQLQTHDGDTTDREVLIVNYLAKIFDQLADKRVDVICIDEGQFFQDLSFVVKLLASDHGKHVIIAALNGTYKQQIFPSVANILPSADKVDWLTAVCFNCDKEAAFTHRFLPDVTVHDEQLGLERHVGQTHTHTFICAIKKFTDF